MARETSRAGRREVGRAMQAYQRSTQAFDDEVGRVLGLNPTDLRCLDWLTEGPMTADQAGRGDRPVGGGNDLDDRSARAEGLRPAGPDTTAIAARSSSR